MKNEIEIVRGTNGQIKTAKIGGVKIKADTLIVEDGLAGMSKVTIIMDAVVSGHTE